MSPLLTWALVILSVVSVARSFNCKNPGDVCMNNAVCSFFGKCECTPGFEGFNCGLDSALISNSTVCTVECQNKGICYSTNQCFCTADFIGERCEKPVDSTVCKLHSMILCSYRPFGFIGEMFLSESMAHCKLKEVNTDVPGYKKFELELPHTSSGNCQLQKTNRDTTKEIVYSTDMATSHVKNKFGLLDSVTRMECAYPQMEVGTITDTSRQRAVDMEILNDSYDPIQSIDIQNPIMLRFRPPPLTAVDGVILTHLEAFVVDLATYTVTSDVLIKDGCPDLRTELRYQTSISIDTEQNGTLTNAIANFKAFMFYEKILQPMQFTYRVKSCQGLCDPPSNCGRAMPATPVRTPKFQTFGQLDIVP